MGYFSNGTEGELYQEEYCLRCVHWKETEQGAEDWGCPVMDAHFLYNYTVEGNILDLLIPRTGEKLGNEQCTMFVQARGGAIDQAPLADEFALTRWLKSVGARA